MSQRFLTDEEIHTAKAMMGWPFWFAPSVSGVVSVGLLVTYVLNRAPLIGFLFLCLGCTALVIWIAQLHEYNRFTRQWHHDNPQGTPAQARAAWHAYRARPKSTTSPATAER